MLRVKELKPRVETFKMLKKESPFKQKYTEQKVLTHTSIIQGIEGLETGCL